MTKLQTRNLVQCLKGRDVMIDRMKNPQRIVPLGRHKGDPINKEERLRDMKVLPLMMDVMDLNSRDKDLGPVIEFLRTPKHTILKELKTGGRLALNNKDRRESTTDPRC